MQKQQKVKCDVLVIGSGGAGSFAAIAAHGQGADVLIVDRGVLGKSGATVTAGHTCCAALGPDDSSFLHFQDTVIGGYYVNNQKLVEAYAEEAPQRIRELDAFGANFLRKENGEFWMIAPPGGHTRKRSVHHGFQTGPAFMKGFLAEIGKQKIRWQDDTIVTSLLTDGKRVVGATGLDLRSGEFVVFEAKSVVVASGGYSQLWAPETTTPVEATGDIVAMAFNAGADLVDMEFQQFLPRQVSPTIKHMNPTVANFPPWREEIRARSSMVNSDGEEIMAKYDKARVMYTTRDLLALATYTEVRAGKKVFLDLTKVPAEIIEDEIGQNFPGSYLPLLAKEDFDLARDPIEISVGAHYSMGGLRINEHCETTLPGLFAAGEATGGVDGANRIGGNAITEILVFGKRAGDSAARYAAKATDAKANADQVALEQGRVYGSLDKSGDVSPVRVKRQMQTMMWEDVAVIRNEKGLNKALKQFPALRKKAALAAPRTRTKTYNLEWVDAILLPRQLDVAEAVATAALARKESRGAQRRDDFPKQDDQNWLRNIVLRKVDGSIQMEVVPLVITKINPAEAKK